MIELSRYAPPGVDARKEAGWFALGSLGAFLFSLTFLMRLTDAYLGLFQWRNGRLVLLPGSVMPAYPALLGWALAGFALLALCLAAVAALHYAYHHQGSKSVYLMRRLPDRWELHRRCLTLPAWGILLCGACALALFFLYYGVYLLVTPPECLPAQSIWFW